MRTADRFFARQWGFPLGLKGNAGFMEEAWGTLTQGPVIVADNVGRYVHERNSAICLEDYPSLAPPWPTFWIEYGSSSGRERRGALVLDTTDFRDTPLSSELSEGGEHVPQLAAGAKAHALLADGVDESDVRWIVTFALFVESEEKVWGPAGIMSLALDEGGQVLGNRWSVAPITALRRAATDRPTLEEWQEMPIPTLEEIKDMPESERENLMRLLVERKAELDGHIHQIHEDMAGLKDAAGVFRALQELGLPSDEDSTWLVRALAPALQTVAFLHCKNMQLDAVEPPPKVQAKRERRGKARLLRYHTLRLEVPRRQSGEHAGGHGVASSLHIVAGHFAHYGACCPGHVPHGLLFGRLSGVYWVPSHVRGDRSIGEVKTDFDVRVPPEPVPTA